MGSPYLQYYWNALSGNYASAQKTRVLGARSNQGIDFCSSFLDCCFGSDQSIPLVIGTSSIRVKRNAARVTLPSCCCWCVRSYRICAWLL